MTSATESLISIGDQSFPLAEKIIPLANSLNVYDSGLMITSESGVIYHRKGFGSEQIVYQFAPGTRTMYLKEYEGSHLKESFEMKFPYTIVVFAYEDNYFKGARHFYSPTPIYDLDTPLYHVNLCNTNTRGYNNTSLGWVCIYLGEKDLITDTSLKARLNHAISRYDYMGEPYNYGNMNDTDGYTTYKRKYPNNPEWWDPATIQSQESSDYLLDPNKLLPCKVDWDSYARAELHSDEGDSYTLRDALFRPHYIYYDVPGAPELNSYNDAEDKSSFIEKAIKKSVLNQTSEIIEDPIDKLYNYFQRKTGFVPANRDKFMKFIEEVECPICYSISRLDPNKPFPLSYLVHNISGYKTSELLSEALERGTLNFSLDFICLACHTEIPFIGNSGVGSTYAIDFFEASGKKELFRMKSSTNTKQIALKMPETEDIVAVISGRVNGTLIVDFAGKTNKNVVPCNTGLHFWSDRDTLTKYSKTCKMDSSHKIVSMLKDNNPCCSDGYSIWSEIHNKNIKAAQAVRIQPHYLSIYLDKVKQYDPEINTSIHVEFNDLIGFKSIYNELEL